MHLNLRHRLRQPIQNALTRSTKPLNLTVLTATLVHDSHAGCVRRPT